jgi:probable HAF family extracellular repeat protein
MNLVKPRLVIFVLLAVGVARGAAGQFVAIDLGTLGADASAAVAVNNRGQVVGDIQFFSAEPTGRAFSWTREGGMVDLGTLGGDSSAAVA